MSEKEFSEIFFLRFCENLVLCFSLGFTEAFSHFFICVINVLTSDNSNNCIEIRETVEERLCVGKFDLLYFSEVRRKSLH